MKITKQKKSKVDHADLAKELLDSFIRKGFTTDQAFQLTLLVLKKQT